MPNLVKGSRTANYVLEVASSARNSICLLALHDKRREEEDRHDNQDHNIAAP